MSDEKMRSEFEAWYCKKFSFENMARRADGTYRGEHAFNSWVSWQAALSQSEQVQVSQPKPINDLLSTLLDSVSGNCYMGKDWEIDTVLKLREFSPPDYEVLHQRVAELEKVLDGLPQDAIDGGWTAKGISRCLKNAELERDRLQSENEALRQRVDQLDGFDMAQKAHILKLEEELNAWKIGYGVKEK